MRRLCGNTDSWVKKNDIMRAGELPSLLPDVHLRARCRKFPKKQLFAGQIEAKHLRENWEFPFNLHVNLCL